MQKLIFSFICLIFVVSANAETVFKKVNPDGSVTFTDQEIKGSKAVVVPKTVTYSAPKLPSLTPIKKKAKPIEYEITIIEPEKDTVFLNKPNVKVSISVIPALNRQRKHQFSYQIGSKTIFSSKRTIVFEDLYRGTHELLVSIVDEDNEIVSSIVNSTFHVKRFFKKRIIKPPVPPQVFDTDTDD